MLRRNRFSSCLSSCIWNRREGTEPMAIPGPASWEFPSSRQLGLDHRRELGASGVLYLQISNLSGCRLQARWRDGGCHWTALCPHQPKPRCWSHEGLRARVCPGLWVCVCVFKECALLCICTWQSSACATCTWARVPSVWAHVSVSGRITSKCILISRVCCHISRSIQCLWKHQCDTVVAKTTLAPCLCRP